MKALAMEGEEVEEGDEDVELPVVDAGGGEVEGVYVDREDRQHIRE